MGVGVICMSREYDHLDRHGECGRLNLLSVVTLHLTLRSSTVPDGRYVEPRNGQTSNGVGVLFAVLVSTSMEDIIDGGGY